MADVHCSRNLCHLSLGITVVILVASVVAALTVHFLASHFTPLTCHVSYASLEFHFTTNNTLKYCVAVSIDLQNPNDHYDIRHDSIEVTATYYKNHGFGMANLTSFHQGKKNATILTPTFEGQIGMKDLSRIKKAARASNSYDIVVKLRLRSEYSMSITNYKLVRKTVESNFACELKFPLISYIKGQSANISLISSPDCNSSHF